MPIGLPLPPTGTPVIDPNTGVMNIAWSNYYLALQNASSSTFAPKDAKFWVSTSNSGLPDETDLGVLSTGYLKITSAIGIATPSTVASIPGADVTGAALARVNDTNVTLTLSGTPATALLRGTTLTLGWSGLLGLSRGGTHTDLSTTGGANKVLMQESSGADVTVRQLLTSDISGLTAGTYTPTLTNGANVAASTAYACQYLRIGTVSGSYVVTVSGLVDIDPTAAAPTATELGISLPVGSNFTAIEQCGGTASCTAIQQSGGIVADVANNFAALKFSATDVANRTWAFSFTYVVLS